MRFLKTHCGLILGLLGFLAVCFVHYEIGNTLTFSLLGFIPDSLLAAFEIAALVLVATGLHRWGKSRGFGTRIPVRPVVLGTLVCLTYGSVRGLLFEQLFLLGCKHALYEDPTAAKELIEGIENPSTWNAETGKFEWLLGNTRPRLLTLALYHHAPQSNDGGSFINITPSHSPKFQICLFSARLSGASVMADAGKARFDQKRKIYSNTVRDFLIVWQKR